MGLLDVYLNSLGESVTLRTRTGTNEYNEPSFLDSTITVIWYDDIRMIRNEQNETLQQLAYIQTTSLIQQGDMITRGGYSWPVIGIQKAPTFQGEQFRIGNLGERQI
jgi:hypothetical protein